MTKITSSIKTRLQVSFLTFIVLFAIAGLSSYKILSTIVAHDELKSDIDQLVSHFAEARKQEKDFILYERKEVSFLEQGDCESIQKHQKALQEIKHLINQIKESDQLEERDDIYMEIQTVKAAIEGYEKTFSELVAEYRIRGFKDHGLEGAMREVIHKLQECKSKEEQWYALMLRRHEKDFFIRQDPKYVETLHKRATEFIRFVEASTLPHMTPEYKEKTIASIQNYVTHFNRIVKIEKEIGLSKEEGLVGLLTEQAEMTEPLLANVQQMVYDKTKSLAGNSFSVMLVSGILMLVCGVGFSLFLARKISSPIIHLARIVEQAKIGDNTTAQSLKAMNRTDELGKLVQSFGNLFGEINQKVKEISEKNEDLLRASQKEKERNWFAEGVSLFEGIMAKHSGNPKVLCDEFLQKLVKFTGSSQAALFLKEKNEHEVQVMMLQSCYALDKKRYINKSVEVGEGHVGAVWQEKEAFYMNDIPESYSKIRSGLGQAKPTAIFIVPAILEDEVEAVVEIGAFREFTANEKELIQQVCKGLAAALARVRLQEQTQQLLYQANTLTEELQRNEEEIRQQLEEMLANQEDYERSQRSLQQEITQLQGSLKALSNLVDSKYKGVLITDDDFNLVYRNEFWQNQLGNETEREAKQKICNLLNLTEEELKNALKHQHQHLYSQVKRKIHRVNRDGKSFLTDVKVVRHRTDQKVFYSVLGN